MDKIALLKEILTQNPADTLARYGLAMEYSNAGNTDEALKEFEILLARNPDYTAAYFMGAQTLERVGRTDEAIAQLKLGIASARRTGNNHAEGEMQAMLDELDH